MNQWGPDAVIRVLVEIVTLVAALTALWKAITAHAKADAAQASVDTEAHIAGMAHRANREVIDANADKIATLDDRVHAIALATPPAIGIEDTPPKS